jgi:hypothetical protein
MVMTNVIKIQNGSIGSQFILKVTTAIALARIKLNGIYNDLKGGLGFEKEDTRTGKSV